MPHTIIIVVAPCLAGAEEIVGCNRLFAKFILGDERFVVPCDAVPFAFAVHNPYHSSNAAAQASQKGKGYTIFCDAHEWRSGSIGANLMVGVGCFQAN